MTISLPAIFQNCETPTGIKPSVSARWLLWQSIIRQ